MSFDEEQVTAAAIQAGIGEDEIDFVLWVDNLDSQVTVAMIYELFLQTGPINSIKLPLDVDGTGNLGYCFIKYAHDVSVPYTIKVIAGTKIFGRKLELRPLPNSIHVINENGEVVLEQASPPQAD